MPLFAPAVARPYVFLPDGWDSAWKAARLASGTTPAFITVLGDSCLAGGSSTAWLTKGAIALLQQSLWSRYGRYGVYYPATHSTSFGAALSFTPTGTMPWSFDGNFNWFQNGLTQTAFWVSAGTLVFAAAGNAVFTMPTNAGIDIPTATEIDLIMYDYASGQWQYTVDNALGTGAVTVGPGSTTLSPGGWGSVYRVPLTGLANAAHAVRISASSVQYGANVCGAIVYDPTTNKASGIGVAQMSLSGAQAFDYLVSPNGGPADRILQYQGQYKTNSTTTVATGFGFPAQPHLAIIELGINDCQNGVGLIQFRHSLRRTIQALRRGRNNASILFMISTNPDPESSDMTGGHFLNSKNWGLYTQEIYDVAQTYNCGVLSYQTKWGETPVAQGYITATDAHPTDAGHAAIATDLIALIA